MTDDRAEPTNPAASEAPLEEPVSRPSLDEEWAKRFADAVAESFEKRLDAKLKPVTDHIEREEVESGKLLRVLAEMSGDFKLMAKEVRASRSEAVAWHQKFATLAERVDEQRDLLDGLKKTVGDHAERITELEKTGTEEA